MTRCAMIVENLLAAPGQIFFDGERIFGRLLFAEILHQPIDLSHELVAIMRRGAEQAQR